MGKKVIGAKMLDKAREFGLQYHGSPAQTMMDLSQCWARDGSMKKAQMVWIVLYGMFDKEQGWEYILKQTF